MRLPNLVIAGVPKAGTTSLFEYLAGHPEVHPSLVKETRFFKTPLGPRHTVADYAAYFDGADGRPVVMEATPGYFVKAHEVAPRMAGVLGKPHIVISLREPVERMRSQHRMLVRAGLVPPDQQSFARFVEPLLGGTARPGSPVSNAFETGCYAQHLATWWSTFDDEVRIVFFDDLAADPAAVVRELCVWLEIDAGVADTLRYEARNQGVRYRSDVLARTSRRLARASDPVWQRHPRLKGKLRSFHDRINSGDPVTSHPTGPDELDERLRALHADGLTALADALRRRGYARLPSWLTEPSRPRARTS